jgi:hypothetical protein
MCIINHDRMFAECMLLCVSGRCANGLDKATNCRAYLDLWRGIGDGDTGPHTLRGRLHTHSPRSHSRLVWAPCSVRRAQYKIALHFAAEGGHTETVKALLAAGSDVGAKDVSGV